MKRIKQFLLVGIAFITFLMMGIYFFQESILFHPSKLEKEHQFQFDNKFEELNILTLDGKTLHAIWFKTDSASKGLIFYLHGNAGSLASWGKVSKYYTELGYDVFMPDYRGYGKSTGKIKSQEQLFADNELLYLSMLQHFSENKIIVLGYSIGSGMAAQLASIHNPKLLILQAPYYSMEDLMQHKVPLLPRFILRYRLPTFEFLNDCKMPIVIFHGDDDELIYYGSSLKLKNHFKQNDSLIVLKHQGHNGMTENNDYQIAIKSLLK